MKKTCLGCKALNSSGSDPFSSCSLGFKLKHEPKKIQGFGMTYFPIPTRSCPKPISYKSLIEYKKSL